MPADRESRFAKDKRQRRITQWRRAGLSIDEIAEQFCQRDHVGVLTAYRWANDLTQLEAANAYSEQFLEGDERLWPQRLSEYEKWCSGELGGREPPLSMLSRLAVIYHTTAQRLIGAVLKEQDPEAPQPESMRDDAILVASPLSGSAVERGASSRLLLSGGSTAAGMAMTPWFPAGQAAAAEHPSQLDATTHIGRIRDRLLRYESIEGRPTSEPIDRPTLERQVVDAWRAFQRSDYSTLGDRLPDLLDQTTLAVSAFEGAATFRAVELQSQALQLTAILLLKQGASNLAWVAADRAMFAAERAQNYLTIASAARILAYALLGAGHHGRAKDLCVGAAARLEQDLDSASPERLSAYGALLLKAGMAAAMQDDRPAALELLELAGRVADRLGRDGNWLWTAFGPTNVAVHRVSAAVELGDAGAAIDHAKQVPGHRLPVLERRAHHLIDLARANGQRRRDDAALAALLDAERLAPEEVYVSPYVHALVVDLLGRTVRSAGELRGLARRARVLA